MVMEVMVIQNNIFCYCVIIGVNIFIRMVISMKVVDFLEIIFK